MVVYCEAEVLAIGSDEAGCGGVSKRLDMLKSDGVTVLIVDGEVKLSISDLN